MSRVLAALETHAGHRPEAIALSSGEHSFTYKALSSEVERAAAWLKGLVDPRHAGAPVAVALDNSPLWVVLDLALIRLNWPSVPVPGFFTAAQRDHALRDAGARLVLEVADGSSDFKVGGFGVRANPYTGRSTALPEGTAKVTYTSGSTGAPKGVCLSQDQMESVAASLVEVIGSEYAGRHLPILPLSVLLENVAGVYATLLAGGHYRVLPAADLGLADPFRPDLARLGAAIADEAATSLILVPELLRALLFLLTFSDVRFPALRLVAVGGAKVSPSLLTQAGAAGLPVFEGYGLSECGSVVALNTPALGEVGTVGRPLPHLRVEVAGDGEIIVGPRPFLGYAGGETNLGPVHTGDLGFLDDRGLLRIEGRRGATIINAYGRNIAPEWVESELLAQPEIRQAIVCGESKTQLGALIVPLHPGIDHDAVGHAVARANRNLPTYAQVARWRIREPLDPARGELTGNGRPVRNAILARHTDFIDQLDEVLVA